MKESKLRASCLLYVTGTRPESAALTAYTMHQILLRTHLKAGVTQNTGGNARSLLAVAGFGRPCLHQPPVVKSRIWFVSLILHSCVLKIAAQFSNGCHTTVGVAAWFAR